MPKPREIAVTSTVIRHQPQFSRLVTIPLEVISPWKLSGTTVIEGTINDTQLGRRTLKRWDDRNCWWIDLPNTLCKRAAVEVGDQVRLKIRLASEELPAELKQLLRDDQTAKANWDELTAAQQRMLREEVLAAKDPQTRTRRARRFLT